MPTLIKRYANRKLYNTVTSRYITLKGIAALIDAGEEIKVLDNETGEDITSVSLSQILVDSERTNSSIPESLLTQLVDRGSDVYGALKKGVSEASEGLEEFQERVKRAMGTEAGGGLGERLSFPVVDLEKKIQDAVTHVFEVLDLPRRSDIERLNRNVERLEKAVGELQRPQRPGPRDSEASGD
ncbi:MAG: polyhydroxyalkanoate synthesis regulator DNA-binding domain-containing protein [Myxococcota bacterium]|jgi:polyhydroxyalkanoate synthesis repressor PhaR